MSVAGHQYHFCNEIGPFTYRISRILIDYYTNND